MAVRGLAPYMCHACTGGPSAYAMTPSRGYTWVMASSIPCRAISANKGGNCAPYKVTNFFFGIAIPGVRIDPKHGINIILSDLDALDQSAN